MKLFPRWELVPLDEPERECSRCHQVKVIDEFKLDPRYAGGRTRECLQCLSERSAEWARNNRERINANRRRVRAANPERTKADRKRYYELYKEFEREQLRRWVDANRDHYNETQRTWRAWRKQWITLKEAAEALEMTEDLVNKAVKEGKVSSHRFSGKIHVSKEELFLITARRGKRGQGSAMRGEVELDAPSFDDERDKHTLIADPRAVDPLDVVVQTEVGDLLSIWIAEHLAKEEQILLMTFVDNDFDESATAKELAVPVRKVRSTLKQIQKQAAKSEELKEAA